MKKRVKLLLVAVIALCLLSACSEDEVTAPGSSHTIVPPVVTDIPNETITAGGTFATVNLDDFVADVETPDWGIRWTVSGNSQLTVTVTNRVATIQTPNDDYDGAETITFTAMNFAGFIDSDAAVFSVTPDTSPPPLRSVDISFVGAGGGGCTNCFSSGEQVGAFGVVSGFQAPLGHNWELKRFGVTEALSNAVNFNRPIYLPGDYELRLTVSDASGNQVSAIEAFSVRHSWWPAVPWNIYTTMEASSTVEFDFDLALKLVELLNASYSWLYHDWVAAEFVNPVNGRSMYLYNRVKKVRFENNMAAILYALVISGDADWWSGNASSPHHWNLSAGSADRHTLQNYVLVSVARIDYPPQHAGDVIHYYE